MLSRLPEVEVGTKEEWSEFEVTLRVVKVFTYIPCQVKSNKVSYSTQPQQICATKSCVCGSKVISPTLSIFHFQLTPFSTW